MNQKKESPLKRIWILAKSEHKRLKFAIVLAILGVTSGFIPYFCAGKIIIMLLNGTTEMNSYIPWLILALVGSIGKVLLTTFSTSQSHIATFAVLAEIRNKCLRKLSNLSMGTLQNQSIGRWKSILVDQIESMEKTLAHLLPEMTSNLLSPFMLLVFLFTIDWRLALISMATLPIGMIFMMTTMKTYPAKYEESVQIGKKMNDSIVEYVNGIEVIKAFNQGKEAYAGYVDAVNANAGFFYGWMKSAQLAMPCYRNVSPAVLVSVLPLGLGFYLNGSISSSKFIMVMILSMGIVEPIIAASNFIDSLAQTGTIIQSVETILQAKEQHHPKEYQNLSRTDIELEHVSFAYEEDKGSVLRDVSLKICQGTVNAFVGPSGSGKSTIAKLIAGFWDVDEGTIHIGGKDIRQIPLAQIADSIAYVSQDNFLFDDTIRENIRMGKENAMDKEVEEVAKKACCDTFIRKLEHGYDTNVGGGGAHLSGGERQRIAIARAMLKDAPIVILDEATAYVDPENEAILQKAISKLVQGKTLIMIAHRLSTIAGADQILLVNNGKIDASGTHEELLKESELYQNMWNAHMGVKDGEQA
ncbi:ABC transporter ATP-binding protein [Clostridium sporogenes]|uniref:ABC transporter ATP-binding protein n=1 Tax=Clostridium sporogenes TaxID=1509 RepID=UPI0013D531DE|nr:ABC transporter ATP-binding protein [Clostridium sporogenes]MCW6123154.1 ABC transporter ATP-binding protein/permease [Clostridium sporogenes]NFT28654.1 ABC transporter ATP-binding protein [Clostridium sporogenes]